MSELHFPFPDAPAPGTAIEIADGVRWARLKLPLDGLDHINVYLIDAGHGWIAVDTGMKSDKIRESWLQLAAEYMDGRPVVGVVVTHMHPDHVGQAGFLCEHFQAPLFMSYGEYFTARTYSMGLPAKPSWTTRQFYHGAGLDADSIMEQQRKWGGFMAMVEPLPTAFIRLEDGQIIRWGKYEWRVVTGRGHSPEHVCLYCEALKLFIAGDQVIAKISPNVSVGGSEPEGNPLAHWMDSLQKLAREVPDDVLVMPAHNLPFKGLHLRLSQLEAHHEDHLQAIEEACLTAKRAIDLLPVMFNRPLRPAELTMGTGECIAHLHLLMQRGRIERSMDDDGVYWFRTLDPRVAERVGHVEHTRDDGVVMV